MELLLLQMAELRPEDGNNRKKCCESPGIDQFNHFNTVKPRG